MLTPLKLRQGSLTRIGFLLLFLLLLPLVLSLAGCTVIGYGIGNRFDHDVRMTQHETRSQLSEGRSVILHLNSGREVRGYFQGFEPAGDDSVLVVRATTSAIPGPEQKLEIPTNTIEFVTVRSRRAGNIGAAVGAAADVGFWWWLSTLPPVDLRIPD